MKTHNIAMLLLRLAVGGMMLFHGIGKLQHGIDGIVTQVLAHGLPRAFAYGVYVGEVVAPLAVVLGLFTRPAACVIASSISTPGITGNSGKWSDRYSSASETFFNVVIDFPASRATIRSTKENFIRPPLPRF